MTLAKDRGRGDVGGLCFLDREPHRAFVDHEAKPPMPVDHGRRGGFLHDLERRARRDVADLDAVDIARNLDDPVRVVAGQIGGNAAARDDVGLLGRGTATDQQRRADPLQPVGGNLWHEARPEFARIQLLAALRSGSNINKCVPFGSGAQNGLTLRPIRISSRPQCTMLASTLTPMSSGTVAMKNGSWPWKGSRARRAIV